MNRNFYRVTFSAALATLLISTTHAQVIGATDVPANLRPIVLPAANGVPLVNIQTPSAAGVSRNIYRQFDVQGNGVILNNSRTSVQTQLGGFVLGNPWLARGPARVILNEVNSGNPTHLRGAIEVAGRRAEVIVANPAGITVNGTTFVNTAAAILTTGVPQFNAMGGLDSFIVREGVVSVEGLGLDARTTDYAAIIARAEQINANVWANALKVVSGANQVSADHSQITPVAGSGPKPRFALDVAHLGGMYANHIFIVGTEAGMGVRNHGSMYAGMGEIGVTADGRFENRGTVEALRIEAKVAEIDNRQGTIHQTGMVGLAITAPTLSNTAGGVVGAAPPSAPSGGSGIAAVGAGNGTSGARSGTVPAVGNPAGSPAEIAGVASPQTYVPQAPGQLVANGGILNDGGRILAGGGIALQIPQINNAGGLLSVTSMAVTGPSFSNAGGTLNVSDSFVAHVGQLDNTNGTLRAGSLDVATSGDFLNQNGTLTSDGHAVFAIGGLAENLGGTLSTASMAMIAGSLGNNMGRITTIGDLGITTTAVTTNAQGSMQAGGNARLVNGGLDNSGGKVLAHSLSVDTHRNDLINTSGTLAASTTVDLQSGALTNTAGWVQAGGAMTMDTHGKHLINTNAAG